MTRGGALSDLNNLLNADDIPCYYKPSIKAVIDTIALEQEPKTMQLVIDNKKQKEFAHEITKKFSFEELALLMYENSCEYCQKQHGCMGKVTPQDCVKNIRQKFEKSYKAESEDKE